jgi:tetratricopeptide (TPR) repeat protein
MKTGWISLAAVCALVIAVYMCMAQSGKLELQSPNAADTYYNLLVQGFRAGQLSLKKEVPPEFSRLADPYDPAVNLLDQLPPYRLNDLSRYHGRLYLYFGVTPALILFWPYVALTGHYLLHRQAVVIFCALGFLASAGMLRALWRRYFAEVSVGVVAACVLALGLATGAPMLLSQADVYEVAISCGYMLTMLALGAIWCALHEPEPRKRSGWLAAASVAYGLAVGARPNLLFGAVILLVPVAQAWREQRRIWTLLIAATGPIVLIGLGLMLYNARRFDSPFEFGEHYQLNGEQMATAQFFSLHYLWFNFRVYFLEPARWSVRSPFVHRTVVSPLPPGHGAVDGAFGILTNTPLVWLALAAPLAWRSQSRQSGSVLRWFVMAVALLFGICALTLGFYWWVGFRYAVDFVPALLLLAVVGILGLERVLAPTSESGQADRAVWRRVARWGWGLLLGFSVVFNLLVTVEHYAGAHNNMGFALAQTGRLEEAIRQYEQALRIKPDLTEAHYNLGVALGQAGQMQEAIKHLEQAVRMEPDYPDAHYNLGAALEQMGRIEAAIGHYEQALRIKPDYAEAHCNLGTALWLAGRMPEAIEHWEQAVRMEPDYPDAHYNLGVALMQSGRIPDAIGHYEQALRVKPDFAEAHYNLGNALMQSGRMPEAMEHLQQALRIKPDYVEAHYNLGIALEQAGKPTEAIQHYQQALRINPDLTAARNALARLQAHQ